MAIQIVTADERLQRQSNIKGLIVGPHKIGKTSLLKTLPEGSALLLDMEAGDLALDDWRGPKLTFRTWEDCRDVACFFGGLNPAMRPDQPYGPMHHQYVTQQYPNLAELANLPIHFWDSISVAGRLCWQWAAGQPESFSQKSGKFDPRNCYGLVGRELIAWMTQIQHSPHDVWMVGGLDHKQDEVKRWYWKMQVEGSKAADESPGIFDEIISMIEIEAPPQAGSHEAFKYRAFVCQKVNPWDVPAGDRSGRLDMIEEPHLGKLMDKIRAGKRQHQMQRAVPQAAVDNAWAPPPQPVPAA